MSTYKSVAQLTKDIEYWLRLAIFLHGPLKETLLHVLHNKSKDVTYNGLPEDPSALYTQLSTTHQNTINSLVKKNVLKKDQLELLLPTNGHKKTYSNTFDITLLVVLIINCTTLPPPVNGWNQKIPLHNDFSVAANVLRAREWRNYLNHTDANSIDEPSFDTKWLEGISIITGLGGSMQSCTRLKTMPLDAKHNLVLKSLKDFNKNLFKKHDQDIDDLKTTVDKNILPNQQSQGQDIKNLKMDQHRQGQDIKCLKIDQHRHGQDIDDLKTKMEKMIDPEQLFDQLETISQELEDLNKLKSDYHSVRIKGAGITNEFGN